MSETEACRNTLAALLITTHQNYVNYPEQRQGIDYWLDSPSEEVSSFLWMCHALGLRPAYMRKRFRELLEEQDAQERTN